MILSNSSKTKTGTTTGQDVYVPEGMPPLDLSGKATSFFEFWPSWLMYIPVAVQWFFLSIRYRSLTLPLLANPCVPLSGMVGVAKSIVFDNAGDFARQWILPWTVVDIDERDTQDQVDSALADASARGFELPLVAKPNFGCRGVGVKLVESRDQLARYFEQFPRGGQVQLQKLSGWDAEAGVFYVREPGSAQGCITSMTLKYTPYVLGDGRRTLAQLVADDPRAGELVSLYKDRHHHRWQHVIPDGEPFRLIFAASHSRGAVFRDANHLINDRLRQSLDRIFDDIPGFHYGRLDIKFSSVERLRQGLEFEIVEINGASSESIHIWDRGTSFSHAISTLLQQYSTLFKLGHANRQSGHNPPGVTSLYRAWQFEKKLVEQYPQND